VRAVVTIVLLQLSVLSNARASELDESTSSEAAPPRANTAAHDAGLVHRGSGKPLVWDPSWRRFGLVDGIAAGASVALGLAAVAVGPDENDPRRGRIALDESVRDALRSDDYAVRRTMRDASDLLVTVNIVYPYIGDALVNAAWYRDSPDVAWQLALMDGEAMAVAFGIQQTVANLVSRERPYVRTCGTDLARTNKDCETSDRFRSYYSGHTSMAFVSAVATCTHHAYVPLHGGQGEWIPCAAGLVIAAGTGVARIGADFHYATDVLTGAAAGSLVGWLVPWLHYTTGTVPEAKQTSELRLTLVPTPGGLGVSGVF
jgi:membrane-associated phospholipid phosphatase